MPNITEKNCRAEVKARKKIYDAACAGLYVSLSPSALPTFFLKYTNPITKRRGTHRLGVYQQGEHDVAFWRKEAWKLRIRIANGEDIAQTARQVRRLQAKQAGITVGEIIDQRIAWFREEVVTRRHTEHGVVIKKAPRNKSWEEQSRHLNRLVRPRLGRMIAGEVTKHDIAQLQSDILEGKLIVHGKPLKASVSSARHMRKAISGLFNWAAEAGRDYVSTSPCVNLPLLPMEEPRKRKLSREEIRTLWLGLDRPDITVDRRIRLALRFALVSMLRSVELLHIHRDELEGHDLNSRYPQVDIPEERVKAGRPIHQPLSDLAVEIANEAMGNYPWMFAGRWSTEPLNKKAMACALRGNKASNGRVRSVGLCEQLGLKPFTPHDLRRTAASLMGSKRASRDNLIERRNSAEASAAAHREKARKLASDGADDAALSAAESAMRREQDRAATLGDALGDVETTIGNLEREIAQIVDQRCRAETAAAVTALADQWATMGATFDAAVGNLADLARESATIVLDAHPLKVFLDAVKQQVPPEAGLVSRVLRDHAKAVLAGTAPASLPKPEAEPAQLRKVEPPPFHVVNTADPVLAAAKFTVIDRGPARTLKVKP